MTRAATEEYQTAAFGLPLPWARGNVGATCTPDASVSETQVFTMTLNLTVNAPVGPRAIGDKLFLVFVDANGGHTISWNAIYRNCPTPSAGTAGQRLSVELRYDGVSWQCVGSSSAFA